MPQHKYKDIHIHLDPIGGIAGDMFVAALLELAPDLLSEAKGNIEKILPRETDFQLIHGTFDHFKGTQLKIKAKKQQNHSRNWAEIKKLINQSSIAETIKIHCLGIFQKLAEAEAEIHGLSSVDLVHFHEIGAIDSIADITAAAVLIEALNPRSWSVSPVPMGSGTIKSSHGIIPLPAPACTILLKEFVVYNDGIEGERVTPTGAAILSYLKPKMRNHPPRGHIQDYGMGFGSRKLKGHPNLLRALVIKTHNISEAHTIKEDWIHVIRFDIDDQTGEDLAMALDILRAEDGILDITTTPRFGKKGRMVSGIKILSEPAFLDIISAMIFDHTTTLGFRISLEQRYLLMREDINIPSDQNDQIYQAKIAHRPNGTTAKLAMDDLINKGSYIQRQTLRHQLEQRILHDHSDRNDENDKD